MGPSDGVENPELDRSGSSDLTRGGRLWRVLRGRLIVGWAVSRLVGQWLPRDRRISGAQAARDCGPETDEWCSWGATGGVSSPVPRRDISRTSSSSFSRCPSTSDTRSPAADSPVFTGLMNCESSIRTASIHSQTAAPFEMPSTSLLALIHSSNSSTGEMLKRLITTLHQSSSKTYCMVVMGDRYRWRGCLLRQAIAIPILRTKSR